MEKVRLNKEMFLIVPAITIPVYALQVQVISLIPINPKTNFVIHNLQYNIKIHQYNINITARY